MAPLLQFPHGATLIAPGADVYTSEAISSVVVQGIFAMPRYSIGLVILIAALIFVDRLVMPISPAAVGVAAGFATILWFHRKKRTVG